MVYPPSGWEIFTSAATGTGDQIQKAWNSETATNAYNSTKSTFGSAASATANSAYSAATTAWNSETAANAYNSTKSTIGSVASATVNSAYSAATTANEQIQKAWNSETAANAYNSTKSTIGSAASATVNSAYSAATTANEQIQKAWNSEAAASAATTAKNATSSTGSYLKSYWSSKFSETSENEKEQKEHSDKYDKVRGATLALQKNANQIGISSFSTKSSNILNIIDKSKISAIGNPELFARVEVPHQSVKFHHLNQFKKSPIELSARGAQMAGYAGKIAEKANEVAPYLTGAMVAVESYKVGKEVYKDYEMGTTRNTVGTVSTTAGTYGSSWLGATGGALIGSWIFPGLGTIFGGLVSGTVAAIYGGHASHVATEKILDHLEWDLEKSKCDECEKDVIWRKFKNIDRPVCCIPTPKPNYFMFWNNLLREINFDNF